MTLYEGKSKQNYVVTGVYVEEAITRRLQALGVNDGTTVYIANRSKKGAMVIKVRGTRLAIGKHIASMIEVSDPLEQMGKVVESQVINHDK